MHEHRLLDRIRYLDKNPARRFSEDRRQMLHSIQDHLQRILNTRQGSTLIAEDYGIPDFTNLMSGYPESKRAIERSLRNTIQKYEPRLQGVKITFAPQQENVLTVSFQISARLQAEDHKDPVVFESVLDAGGHVIVKS
jgi:type VI secretion system protein